MARYKVEKLFDDDAGTENFPEANLPTSSDVETLFGALEDCLSSAARQIHIHDKGSYFQYQNIMEAVNHRYENLAKAYYESFEMIAMHAGKTDLGKTFEKLDAETSDAYDRTWYKTAYNAVKEKRLTRKILRKRRFGF